MKFTRNLRLGDSGEDVLYIKQALFALGQYKKSITKISNNKFRSDTVQAVKTYQRSHIDVTGNTLDVDGIIGKLTWNAIVRDFSNKTAAKSDTGTIEYKVRITSKDFPNLSPNTINLLNQSWNGISEARIEFCKVALKFAYDPNMGGNIKGLYVWGDNLYNKDLTLNVPTVEHIQKQAKGKNAKYFNGGRAEMMIAAIKKFIGIVSADCSGLIVGIARLLGYIKAAADATANGLCGSGYSTAITREALQPGDFVGYNGHIGLYIGKSMVCEAAGGAYGIQITNIDTRIRHDFVDGSLSRGKAWTKYRRPKWY